jgi:outer membrane receptor protein involved in Fe transport
MIIKFAHFRGMVSAVALTGFACSTVVYAQDDSDTPESQREELENIVVTGTRLSTRGFDAPTPVSVVDAEEFTLSGTQNAESLLLDTPQFSGNQLEGPKSNTVQAGQPIGVATLNLRNFGATRNLVLVNGRRFAITGPAMTTDINTIPVALIERTEIVTGGSSAVYGSDAITGVVNFVLRDDFEGVELDAQSSWDEPTSTPFYGVDLTFGGNFDNDRGNLTASIGYLQRGGFTAAERGDFAASSLSDGCVTADSYSGSGPGTPLSVPSGQTCTEAGGRLGFVTGGSSAVPNGRIGNLPLVGSAQSDPALDAALIAAGLQNMTSLGAVFDEAGQTVRPFMDPGDRFDLGPDSFVVTPQERWMANVFGNYDFNDKMNGYMEVHFSSNTANVQIAPTNVTGNALVETDNPYLSSELQDVLTLLDGRETGTTTITRGTSTLTTTPNDGLAILDIQRRFNDLPTRYADADHRVFRTVVGTRGDLGNVSEAFLHDLSFDAYYSYATTNEVEVQTGSVSISRIQQSMLSQNGNPPVLNLFGNGNITPEAAAAIGISAVSKIEAEQEVAVASLTGVAFDMPAGPVDFATGLEWRDSSAEYIPDSFLSSGDVSGWNSARATSGRQSVKEIFGEIRVPILADKPAVERLNLNGAFRYSDYDVGSDDGVWTYSAGVEWAVTAALSFRGQFQHAIRAPNVGELFGGQGSDGPTALDPCSALQPASEQTEAVRDTCVATGVPESAVFTAGVQPSPFLTQIRGGNPELNPEESDTTTFGVVFQPDRIPGLAMTVDYFSIELDDAIAPLGGGGLQNVLDLCYSVLQDPDSVYCQAVNRDPLSGQIAGPKYVFTTNANIGGIETSGFDFQASYGFDTDWGLFGHVSSWSLSTAWTYTDEFTVTPIQDLPDLTNECVGAWGGTCGQPLPEWKGTSRATWNMGPTTLSLRARVLGKITTDRIAVPRARGESFPSPDTLVNPTIDRYVYLDFTGGYAFSDDTQVTVGIRNLLDKEPPVLGSLQQGGVNTIPATYDVQGRVFFASIGTRF